VPANTLPTAAGFGCCSALPGATPQLDPTSGGHGCTASCRSSLRCATRSLPRAVKDALLRNANFFREEEASPCLPGVLAVSKHLPRHVHWKRSAGEAGVSTLGRGCSNYPQPPRKLRSAEKLCRGRAKQPNLFIRSGRRRWPG